MKLCRLALVFLCATLVTTARAQTPGAPAKWEKDMAAFAASDRTNPPPTNAVLFIGSSSIRLWKSLARDFPEHQVINRGFGGSEIADSVHFAEQIVFPYRPRLIVMYAGGNDLSAGKTPGQVAKDFKEFAAKIHAALPRTRLAYISIAPNPARWAQIERVKETNRLIEEFTRSDARFQFINVFPHMLGLDGLPRPEIFVADRLHMNERGYAIWRGIVGPFLQ